MMLRGIQQMASDLAGRLQETGSRMETGMWPPNVTACESPSASRGIDGPLGWLLVTTIFFGAFVGSGRSVDAGADPVTLRASNDNLHSTSSASPDEKKAGDRRTITITVQGATAPDCATRLASEMEIAVNKRIIAELAQRGLSDKLDLPATATDIRLAEQKLIKDEPLANGGLRRTIQITFGDRFEAHVARRIREHLVRERLVWTGAASGVTLMGLTFLWGTLKVTQGRYLRQSARRHRHHPA